MDDQSLARMLLERGLLTAEEFEDAEIARRMTGRPLADILVEKTYLSPVQMKDALACVQKRVRFCARCNVPVYVTRVTLEGERCPRCLGPAEWREEEVVERIRDLESIVQLTRDELPPEVQAVRSLPGRLFGKYVLVEEVGHGGAGVVHRAWDTMLGEYVALKFIREQKHAPGQTAIVKRTRQEQIFDLLQEARKSLRLRHKHIVAIRDIGRIDQQFYIAMEFIEGDTLWSHIRAAQTRGRLSPLYENPSFYLGVLRDVSNAIHYAHTFPKPIVHCDLKPNNILISVTGTAYVMDFGLARVLGSERDAETGDKIRGTPAYMAPEQLSGRNDEIGTWSDIYALGATMYELLAGRQVFTGEPVEIMLQAMRDDPEPPSDVVRKTDESRRRDSTRMMTKITKLEEICLRCLAKKPKDRCSSARQVAEALETVLAALAAGHETGIVPQRVIEAQERAEFREVDEEITHLKLEEAIQAADKIMKKRDSTRIQHWIADRRRQVEFLHEFRNRLVDLLNAQRPSFAKFQLVRGALEGVEVLKATTKKLYVLMGDRPQDVDWAALPPVQVVDMAEAVKMQEPVDRLALGILCHHSRMIEPAVRYLTSLRGTPFEEAGRQILDSTA